MSTGPVAPARRCGGPLASIIMGITGRKAALADLTGDGVATRSGRDLGPAAELTAAATGWAGQWRPPVPGGGRANRARTRLETLEAVDLETETPRRRSALAEGEREVRLVERDRLDDAGPCGKRHSDVLALRSEG